MAKNQNTFAKRQREMEKKFKAQNKLKKRLERKTSQETLSVDRPIGLQENSDNDKAIYGNPQ
ncbi:MAG TPA: hypothetical protein PKD64_19345 [Pirellulaceae bacterium]|nr:hypothetical protein [Pirellulaceae bacterium]HMO94347.1 hypothetical protein [Pirellulaceae bacterium]HMP71443.1 hypothetical protein [Pirellulaceae bacterium]